MKNFHSNHNHTLGYPEALPKDLSRFFTTFRMTFSPLSSSDLSLPRLSSSGIIAVVLACLLLTTPTQAKWGDNCTLNGGTIIKANQYGMQNGVNLDKGGYCHNSNDSDALHDCNGMEFCQSGKKMTWWSAFTWCESIGGKLASFEHMCPGTPARIDKAQGACPNLTKVGSWLYMWSNVGWTKKSALNVNLENGGVYGDGTDARSRQDYWYAFCEE